jgi:hypothetical protein
MEVGLPVFQWWELWVQQVRLEKEVQQELREVTAEADLQEQLAHRVQREVMQR